jgi:para-aminobenzoate synthetase component I
LPTLLRRRSPLATSRTWALSLESTPEIAFRIAAARPFPFFLDGATATADGRYSFVGHSPVARLEARGRRIAWVVRGEKPRRWRGDPWEAVRRVLGPAATGGASRDLPFPFRGGWVGYFGYDLGRAIERLPSIAARDLPFPDLHLARYETFVAFDRETGRATLVGAPGMATDAWLRDLDAPPAAADEERDDGDVPRPELSRSQYLAAVRRVKRYVAAGDVYQVNLAHRFSGRTRLSAARLHERLRRTNPAPFGAFVGLDGLAISSSSPERFLRVDGREVVTRPIKGTRPRGTTLAADAALRRALASSEKDHAELAMIVDLERNDLGRVCEFGSVRASWPPAIESYATVHHLVAAVSGTLRRDADRVDLLRATFPGGSITGAPKIRAMEIVEELEPCRRSVYTGAIGHLGDDGSLDLNVAIRTVLHRSRGDGGDVWFHAGGGIVADSDPESEWEETLAKAEGLRRAFERRRG